MDELTRTDINNFIAFLTRELAHHKHYSTIQVGEWGLRGNRVTIEIFLKTNRSKIFFDVREIKENQDRLDHLLANALDQLESIKEENIDTRY